MDSVRSSLHFPGLTPPLHAHGASRGQDPRATNARRGHLGG